jgi:hypothetical protein
MEEEEEEEKQNQPPAKRSSLQSSRSSTQQLLLGPPPIVAFSQCNQIVTSKTISSDSSYQSSIATIPMEDLGIKDNAQEEFIDDNRDLASDF